MKRRSSSFNTQRIDHIYQDPHITNRNLHLHYGELTGNMSLIRITTAREKILKFRVNSIALIYPFCCILGLSQLQITAYEKYTFLRTAGFLTASFFS